jgi:hypothetical protein
MPPAHEQPDTMEAPPFLKTWPRVYGAIVSGLAVLLVLLYLITKAFQY